MRRMMIVVVSVFVVLFLFTATIPLLGQAVSPAPDTSSQAPTAPRVAPRIDNPGVPKDHNPPDMVCFGYYPNWSIQFTNGEARYLGFNEPDRYFEGDFYWVPNENAWEWHRANGLAPMNGGFALSATIEKSSCSDPVQKTTDPFSASVYLPQGDMVSGCCRKLKPGEAAIGHHGVPSSASTQGTTMPAAAKSSAPVSSNAPVAGHPVDVY